MPTILNHSKSRSSHSEVFLGKAALKICNKFTGEHPCEKAISIKGCSHVNLLHVFRTSFSKKMASSEYVYFCSLWLLLNMITFVMTASVSNK